MTDDVLYYRRPSSLYRTPKSTLFIFLQICLFYFPQSNIIYVARNSHIRKREME